MTGSTSYYTIRKKYVKAKVSETSKKKKKKPKALQEAYYE